MTTRTEVVSKLIETKARFESECGIRMLALFGSFARGEQTDSSDVDVLVDMEKPTFDNYMDLKFFIEDKLGLKVDLVLNDTLKSGLRALVEKEMIRV